MSNFYARPKPTRKWVKMEKRLVRAMYRAGLLDHLLFGWNGKPVEPWTEFFWDYLHPTARSHRHRWPIRYVPCLTYSVRDYWGESEERSLTLHANLVPVCKCDRFPDDPVNGPMFRECIHDKQCSTRSGMLRYVRSLPVKRNDHKINRVLRTIREE